MTLADKWIEQEITTQSEVFRTQEDKYCMYALNISSEGNYTQAIIHRNTQVSYRIKDEVNRQIILRKEARIVMDVMGVSGTGGLSDKEKRKTPKFTAYVNSSMETTQQKLAKIYTYMKTV